MPQRHRIIITYADEIGADTRQQLERALSALEIEHAPTEANDDVSGAETLPLHVASPETEHFAAPAHPHAVRLLIAGNTDTAPKHWLPVAPHNIGAPSRQWTALLRALGQQLERPGLSAFTECEGDPDKLSDWAQRFPQDPLAAGVRAAHSPAFLRAELEAAIERARQAEEAAIERDTARKQAEHAARIAGKQSSAVRNEADILRHQVSILKSQLEDTAWSPFQLKGEARQLVEAAREAVWRARTTVADAQRAAEMIANPLEWPKAAGSASHPARYDGESQNGVPHGLGVIVFLKCGSTYSGEFSNGQRHGFGAGIDAEGRTWIGRWQADQPDGFGALELPDGARREGEVRPASDGAPAMRNLHHWPAPGEPPARKPRPFYIEAPRQLPSPADPASFN